MSGAPGEGPAAQPPRDTDVTSSSVGELIGEVSRDLSTLMRQELELAKAEIKQEIAKAGRAAGMFGGAALAGYMLLFFLSITLWWALANVMDEAWAALIVAAVWGLLSAVLYVLARGQLRLVSPQPERTVDTLKQVPDALKGREQP
ncbi:MAG: phage holin family protein [Nocardioidaceae bacterium]